jgi:hypothetical protein
MSALVDAIAAGKALGKKALYFGCWDSPGHFLHDVGGRTIHSHNRPSDLPWDIYQMDATFLKNGKVPDEPTGKVYWTCGGKGAFWYAFYWWDRSVDKRGACNSGLYVRGFGYPEMQEAFNWACSQFPYVVNRQEHPLVLQLNFREKNV